MHNQYTKNEFLHPLMELLVKRIIQSFEKDKLGDLKNEFHDKLGLARSNPDNPELIEDLWDFFYDWCIFEKVIVSTIRFMPQEELDAWEFLKVKNYRGLFSVMRINANEIKIKDLHSKKMFVITSHNENPLIGFTKGDIFEARIVEKSSEKYCFVRKPAYHPMAVIGYIRKKVRNFNKTANDDEFLNWLWMLVGMHIKTRFYPQMPVQKIYDDNSRI